MKLCMMRYVGLILTVGVVGALVGCGGGGGVLTLDRIGKEDASKTMTLQLNNSYTHQSSTPSWADGFEKLFTKFAEDHPDWKLELEIIPDDQTTQEQARLLEEARVGRAPDCRSSSSACGGWLSAAGGMSRGGSTSSPTSTSPRSWACADRSSTVSAISSTALG